MLKVGYLPTPSTCWCDLFNVTVIIITTTIITIVMNDSGQDFVDLCSKMLKRSRKKEVDAKQKRSDQTSSQANNGDRRRNMNVTESRRVAAELRTGHAHQVIEITDNSEQHLRDELAPEKTTNKGCTAKEKLIIRMQEFKRVCPRMIDNVEYIEDPSPESEIVEQPTSDDHMCPRDSDEALAMSLQQQLDREASEIHKMDLATEGLFLCHICHRNISHMTSEGRTRHINRKFKMLKSRSAHLKRCSAEMGISPADLLQGLQRQAEETQRAAPTTISQTGGTKRKCATQAAARKKSRKKTEIMDENTEMALALSSSLLEQWQEQLNATKAQQTTTDLSSTPVLKWKPDSGKGCDKRKKGTVPRPPPILLIQDVDVALTRLQERVATHLLQTRAPSPSTPTRCPSTVSTLSGAAPLWQKSALPNGNIGVLDFVVPELKDYITPRKSVQSHCTSTDPNDKSSIKPSLTPFPPATGKLPSNSHALKVLVDLSDNKFPVDYGEHIDPDTGQDQNASLSSHFQMTGFFLEDDISVIGTCTNTNGLPAGKSMFQHGAAQQHSSLSTLALSNLASNLSSMVNNPQLSDWQLQVDSGQVFYAHSFIVYARCPLLAEMMHGSGFGVCEKDIPTVHRVLICDVPGEAVLVLLQYLYSASVSLPASLKPHVLELASRFNLPELQQLCELHAEDPSAQNEDEAPTSPTECLNKTDMALAELFNSMWSHEDDAEQEGNDKNWLEIAADITTNDRELHEEQMNEEELNEIYEFAATQRKRGAEIVSVVESEGDDGEVSSKLTEPIENPGRFCDKTPEPESDPHLDCSLENPYDCFFSTSEGVCKQYPPSLTPPRAHTSMSTLPGTTILHSSVSLAGGSSLNTSNLPVPGVSPDKDRNDSSAFEGREVVGVHSMPQKQLSGANNVSLLPNSPHKKEPELIILSGSSEEMDIFNSQIRSQNSSLSHSQPELFFTHLKSSEPTVKKEQLRNLECGSITDLSPSPKKLSPGDCSPEFSWLIPCTPVSAKKTSMEGSDQSKISSCRTKLFPEENKPESAEVDPKQDTPLQLHVELHSSTPLHSDVFQHHNTNTFPVYTQLGKEKSFSPNHESPEGMQLESFHLSPLSDPSEPHSSTSHGRLTSLEKESKYLSPACSISFNCTGVKGTTPEDRIISALDNDRELGGVEERATPNVSFEQSLIILDEPPIAFNDSWGLDTCNNIAGNPGSCSPGPENSKGCTRHYQQPQNMNSQPSTNKEGHFSSSLPDETINTPPEISDSLLVANMRDCSGEEDILPLSQRLNIKTPSSSHIKSHHTLVPITPMPHFSDMDTPELKNKLKSFGVRVLPKRQMILKLKEIHHFTHQLVNSDSDEEGLSVVHGSQTNATSSKSVFHFKETSSISLTKRTCEDEDLQPLPNSQDSNSSSTTSTDESERHNPELCPSSGRESDSDGGISASQAVTCLKDRLQAVHKLILSDSGLCTQILQYQPLIFSQLRERLKLAGIHIGATKLVNFLDSQCITFTTAKPGQTAPTRRRVKKKGKKVTTRK
ncbi:structure-specific endonuclease subunit SLX4 isoform X2 [Stigmatopora nigra]